jgi:S1-C subfamily serine protease
MEKLRVRIGVSKYHRVRLVGGLAAATLVFVAAFSVHAHELHLDQIKSLKRAVVIVTTYDDCGKPLLQGSGFFVAPDRVVTNLHVISRASQIRVTTFAGKTFNVQTIVATDERSDLAILHLDGPHSEAILPLMPVIPAEGESIILLSNPQGSHWKVAQGRVGKIWQFENIGTRMQITAGVFPGSSGGPVLNQQGQVVAIAVMRMDSADDLNFAVPADSLKILQASASIAGNRAGSTPTNPADRSNLSRNSQP